MRDGGDTYTHVQSLWIQTLYVYAVLFKTNETDNLKFIFSTDEVQSRKMSLKKVIIQVL